MGRRAVLQRTLFEETPLGAGRNQYIHSFFHPASKQATTAKQSKAQHNTTQQPWGNLTGQLHSLHSPGCPRRRQLATGPLHRHFQTADAKSGTIRAPAVETPSSGFRQALFLRYFYSYPTRSAPSRPISPWRALVGGFGEFLQAF